MDIDQLASAQSRAAEPGMGGMALVGLVQSLRASIPPDGIQSLYAFWIERHPGDPLLYAVLFNYAVVLTDAGDLSRARECLERALSLNPDFMPALINLGRIHERLGVTGLALRFWASVVDKLAAVTGTAIVHKVTALNQAARVLEAANQDTAAEAMLFQSLDVDPAQSEAAQHYLSLRQRQCKWPVVSPWERVDRRTLMRGLSPLSAAVLTDDPMLHLALAAHYNERDVGTPSAGVVASYRAARRPKRDPSDGVPREGDPAEGDPREGDPAAGDPAAGDRGQGGYTGRLRIGYLSSDLRGHAVGHLMAEVFGLHDRSRVEVFAYYCGPAPAADDVLNARFKASVDHWIPISQLDDTAAARRIEADGIHILVDLNGYTRDGRTKLVALRPAPVIVNWLGYPGSMGSPYHHYIIADDWIIPKSAEIYYSETVLRLPCYQPNDRQRAVSPSVPTRAEAGLPPEAMVYCCFNATHKITRFTFERWMSILRRVPHAVLWLLGPSEASRKRLRDFASARGVAPERLIFAEKLANPHHLARHLLADLFLDTVPYGAHTTASDALWMGVPVLTLSGRSFASRVGGSLVRAAGLPELVCATAEAYVERAVALGSGAADHEAAAPGGGGEGEAARMAALDAEAGQKGAGQKGAGQKGAGQKGAGQKGAGQKGAGQKGAGQKGVGHKEAVQEAAIRGGMARKGEARKRMAQERTVEKGPGEKAPEHQRAELRHYRDRLLSGRETAVLFDMPLLVLRLEQFYASMWRHFEAGTLPRPDLSNLDVYLEVGEAVDHEEIEVGAIEDYRGWWMNRLSRRHAVRPIGPDSRLCGPGWLVERGQ
jgi:predicted O-linked N-acetylglucosamine transferase (SPINDLY family)